MTVESNFEKVKPSPPNAGFDFQNAALGVFTMFPYFLLQ